MDLFSAAVVFVFAILTMIFISAIALGYLVIKDLVRKNK